jgi:hypothetical protein
MCQFWRRYLMIFNFRAAPTDRTSMTNVKTGQARSPEIGRRTPSDTHHAAQMSPVSAV